MVTRRLKLHRRRFVRVTIRKFQNQFVWKTIINLAHPATSTFTGFNNLFTGLNKSWILQVNWSVLFLLTRTYDNDSNNIIYRCNKKSELMLMIRAKTYSSSCLQVGLILVYVHPLRRNSFFCSQKLPENHQKPLFLSLKSFKVINVDIFKKLVTSACYDKQHDTGVCRPPWT